MPESADFLLIFMIALIWSFPFTAKIFILLSWNPGFQDFILKIKLKILSKAQCGEYTFLSSFKHLKEESEIELRPFLPGLLLSYHSYISLSLIFLFLLM